MGRKKVVIKCLDICGSKMAGPAIRATEIAKALSDEFEVVLLIPNTTDFTLPGIVIGHHSETDDFIKGAHAFFCQHIDIITGCKVLFSNMLVIIDSYDPEPLEHIELFKNDLSSLRKGRMKRLLARTDLDLALADLLLAASPRQKDLWLGYAIAARRITHEEQLEIRELPFGCPETFSRVAKESLIARYSIQEEDLVLLWGGGIWNWFDPLTLIRAVNRAKEAGVKIKLLFMGVRHPNELIPEMEMVKKAVDLAKKLSLYEKEVFFHFGWTPYEERAQFYTIAHIGVSTHFCHLETRFSFRTRLLDYFWAGLPVIVSSGDYLSEEIEEMKAGFVVPAEDENAVFDAIMALANDPLLRKKMGAASHALAVRFRWSEVTKGLISFLRENEGKRSFKRRIFMAHGWIRGFFATNFPALVIKTIIKKIIPKRFFS